MTTHELLGEDCMSFADWHDKSHETVELINEHWWSCDWENILVLEEKAREFLTQPLTPEWMEKYLGAVIEDGWVWINDNVAVNFKSKGGASLFSPGQCIYVKHPSHLFDSLPPEIKIKYKNVEI